MARAQNDYKGPSFLEGLWKPYRGGADAETPEVDTGVDKATLKALLAKLATLPEGFTPHRDIERTVLKVRQSVVDEDKPFHWSIAENLAYASLLAEGSSIRLSGQDSERGTFSHRHAVLHDVKTGDSYTALRHLGPDQGEFRLFNSPLSEFGVPGLRVRLQPGHAGRPGDLGGPVRRLRQQRPGGHRPVHRLGRGQVEAPLRPDHAAAPRLRGRRAPSTPARAWSASWTCARKTTCRSSTPPPRRRSSTSCAARCGARGASR